MSAETKHTPGKWEVSGEVRLVGDPYKDGQRAYWIGDVNPSRVVDGSVDDAPYRGPICHIQSCDHLSAGIVREEAEANARLIAAAPDMLAALKEAETLIDHDEECPAKGLSNHVCVCDVDGVINRVVAAIKKAGA